MAELAPGKTAHDVFLSTGLAEVYNIYSMTGESSVFKNLLYGLLCARGIEIHREAVDWSNPQSIMDALADCATFGDVVSLFSRQFQLVLPIDDDERAQLLQETRHEDMEAAKRAWEIKYIISDKVLELVACQLRGYADQWDSLEWYVPLTALVQSSGWGKSRLMCQMWRKGFYVVYISCMKGSQSGFPRRTTLLADIMQDLKSTESSFVALVASILAVLSRHADTTCEEWMAAQEESDDIQKEIHAEFQTMVKSCRIPDQVKSLTRSQVETYHETFCKAEIDKLKQGARVLLCVDEAGELGDNFAKFRRSLRSIPRGGSFFSVALGTDRMVADLAAAAEDDPTARVRLAPSFHVFHPIYLVGKSDIFAPAGAGSSGSDTAKRNTIRYGRPLWAAYYDSVSVDNKLNATLRLAMKKLLGMDINTKEPGWVTRDIAIAVFACIVGLDVVAWGTLPQELVARHMRTIVCISRDRRRVYTAAAAEPVLAAAAARLLHDHDDTFLGVFLDKLTEVCLDGLVLEGVRGEIVARIVIMLAMHECTKSDDYIKPVPLATFLETMFGSKVVQELKENAVNMEATVFFNCFVPTSVQPSPRLLDDCFVRCAALVARRNERVLDFALPARAGLPDGAASAALPERPTPPRAAKKAKVDLPPLQHRISFPGQVKNQRGQPSLTKAKEKLQEDDRLDARLELLFQIGDRGEGEEALEVDDTTVIVRGLEGFEHLKSERMKKAKVLEKLRILSRTCEDVFKDASIEEKAVLQELIPLGFNPKRFLEDEEDDMQVENE